MKLDDVEWSNNVVFLIHNSPRAILRCHDNFWCGLAEIQLANYENAEMRLEQVAKEDPNYLGALFLQQQLCRTEPSERNQTRFKELDGEIKALRNGASSIEFEFAAIAQYAIGKPSKAAEYLDKSLKRHGVEQRTLALRCAVESKADKMDSLLEQIPEDTNCALGQYYLAEKLLRARQHTRAQALTENMLQANSSCSLAHVQMVKAAFGVQDWDVVNSSSSWLISVIPQFWDGYMYLALESLLTTGSETAAADRLESMISNAGDTFPKAVSFARLLVRTVGQSKVLSPQIEKMLAKCADSADAKTVRGDYYLITGNVRKAKECYNEALSMDHQNPGANVGLVWCWLRLGDRRRAKQQLDMAGAIPEEKKKQLPELHLLEVELGLVANKFDGLKTATVEITKNLAGRAYDLSLLEELNPNLCLEILKCYMKLIDKEEVRTAAKLPNHVKRAERLLTVVKNAVGGLTPVKVVDAEFKCMIGKFEDAEEVLRRMVPGPDVYLLQAKVANERADPDSARRLLDSALAADYDFGEHCPYQLVAAETAMLKHNFGEAIKLLNRALASGNLTENESVAANLKLSEAFRRNGQANESSNVMEKIEKDFSSASAVAAKLALSKAEQLLDAGNVEAAIATLEDVAYDTAGAFQAKARLAEIYLVQRRNEERYLTVFRDICHNRPGEFEPLVAFADSLMRVNRIDDAVRTYEAALRLKKTDTALQVKIGQAMAITHDYSGAISYYRNASLVSSECGGLRLELADLFVRLGQIEDAIATLEEAYDDPAIDKMLQARCYYKHADILAEDYKTDEALQKLAKAKNLLGTCD